jgi:hypothetical protein
MGLSCGGVDYIAKPISAPIVQARVRTHLALYDQNRALEDRVRERTGELLRANEQLSQEIEERKVAEKSLQSAYAEIKQLKDRFQAESVLSIIPTSSAGSRAQAACQPAGRHEPGPGGRILLYLRLVSTHPAENGVRSFLAPSPEPLSASCHPPL